MKAPMKSPPARIAAATIFALALTDPSTAQRSPMEVRGVETLSPGDDESAGQDPTVRGLVTISHVDDESWRFEYDLSRDTRSIMLGPRAEAYHASAWALPDDFHVTTEGIYSFLERKDGGAFRKVAIDVSTYRPIVPYAPQPFAAFDRGTAVNTGPLGYAARVGPSRMMAPFDPKFTFAGLPGETVIIPGHEKGSVTEIDIPSNGLFVYFGDAEGIRATERVLSILDHDFPEALMTDFLTAVEKFATLYDRELRDALPGKLVIMVSYDNAASLGFGGGAQNFQIVAKGMGPENAGTTPEDLTKSRLFFAHEMVHIWQANLGNDDARWFGEGEADLLALRSLERLGYRTAEEVAADLTRNVAECIEGLRETDLLECHKNGRPDLNYSGGVLVLAAAVAATSADGDPDDVFALDVALAALDDELRVGRPIEAFQTAVRNLGGTEAAAGAIRSFIIDRHEDARLAVTTLFDATGFAYRIEGDAVVVTPSPADAGG